MSAHVIVWDLETVPDLLLGFAPKVDSKFNVVGKLADRLVFQRITR
jgi:hypothetical protein